MRFMRLSVVALSMLGAAGVVRAAYVPGVAFVEPNLSGVTQYDGWIGLTAVNYPGFGGFPGTGAWPSTVGSNRTTSNTFNATEPGDAVLSKSANGAGGGPYLAGESIYFGGFSSTVNNPGGALRVTDTTPVAGIQNVVFQVQIGEAWTWDFTSDVLPTLSYNGGTQNLVPVYSSIAEQFFNGTVTMPSGPENVYINTHVLQWDLSGIVDPIASFSVDFGAVQHAQVYGLRLDQSSTFTLIPAPGAGVLVGAGALLAARRRRA